MADHPSFATGSCTIDCATCVMRHTEACNDCVVTFICSREPDHAVVIPLADYAALREMGEAGLVPRLRHESRPHEVRPVAR